MTAEEKVKKVHPRARYRDGMIQIPVHAVFWKSVSSNKREPRAWSEALRRIEAERKKRAA